MQNYTAIIKNDNTWWYGWVEEIPGVNCQEKTHTELLFSLQTCLKEAIEFNREEAIKSAMSDYKEELLSV